MWNERFLSFFFPLFFFLPSSRDAINNFIVVYLFTANFNLALYVLFKRRSGKLVKIDIFGFKLAQNIFKPVK